MNRATAPVKPPVQGMETIKRLEARGVHVASGAGTPQQVIPVVSILISCLAIAVYKSIHQPVYLIMLPAVVVAIDFLSGFVHWFFDTQVKPSNTFLGRIAVDILDHHVRPGRTAEVGFMTSAWRPALMVAMPLVSIAVLLPWPSWLAASIFWIGFLSVVVPQTHKEAHMSERPAMITWMQKTHLIINPDSHQAHHDDNRESFCVFTGWLNPILNKTRFWRGMELLFDRVRGR